MTPAIGLSPDVELDGLAAGAVYLVVFGFVFVESGILVGFLLPGDTLLFAAGLLAAAPGSGVAVVPLVAGTVVAAVGGDALAYQTGRRLGRPWLATKPRLSGPIARAESFYTRYGAWAVVIARWFAVVRTATPVVAGVARMRYRTFLAANVVGACSWGAGVILLGYYAYAIPWLRAAAIWTGIAGSIVAVLALAVHGLRARRRGARRVRT